MKEVGYFIQGGTRSNGLIFANNGHMGKTDSVVCRTVMRMDIGQIHDQITTQLLNHHTC
jgi:hypothetical protein